MTPITVSYRNGNTLFYFEQLSSARICNRQLFACRFITVDVDIEHNENVIKFYEKNDFVPNAEMNNKRTQTISMRKDIYK